MVRGIEQGPIVHDDADRTDFIRRLGILAADTGTPIYAWALMSNHAHILLCSGKRGLAHFMRRLLTGYAVAYNLRHARHGHLFQNRYKSIVCDADSYFTELVRYIHLNPLRVGLVKDLKELERYPYCGHGAILGRTARRWQDCGGVLSQFGKRVGDARHAYRSYVAEGVGLGRRPELVGGGLPRSAGDWFGVRSQRPRRVRQAADGRILGNDNFVERILRQADRRALRQHGTKKLNRQIERYVVEQCKKDKASITELRSGSRRGGVPVLRRRIVCGLVENYGVPAAEVARQVGISTSGVSKILIRSLSS
jgi:REP element-mobilizing transposase RayT